MQKKKNSWKEKNENENIQLKKYKNTRYNLG